MIRIALIETDRGTVRGYAPWVDSEGARYRIDWEVSPDSELPPGIAFGDLLAAARAGLALLEDGDGAWSIEDRRLARGTA